MHTGPWTDRMMGCHSLTHWTFPVPGFHVIKYDSCLHSPKLTSAVELTLRQNDGVSFPNPLDLNSQRQAFTLFSMTHVYTRGTEQTW